MPHRSSTKPQEHAVFYGYELTVYGPDDQSRFWRYSVVRDGLEIQSLVNPGKLADSDADAKSGAEHEARTHAFSIKLQIPTESSPSWEAE